MCGIFCVYDKNGISADIVFPKELKKYLHHRGPDGFAILKTQKCVMAFNRLAINDTSQAGMQPFVQEDGVLVCNGEVYNHREIHQSDPPLKNDCACLIPLIQKYGILAAADMIRGVFALCYYDDKASAFYAARDPIGVRPLFYARRRGGMMVFASEVKSITPLTKSEVQIFPPGHIYDSRLDKFVCYYPCYWTSAHKFVTGGTGDDNRLVQTLTKAVERRIANTDRDVCFLLSGGLDSSLMVAIARRLLGPSAHIKTFSIGTENSPDCKAALRVSEYLNTDHTEVRFDTQTGIDALYDVILCIESYDTTTVRASVPMWLLCKHISENTEYRVVISGEGSDEIFGGYLYFHYAPTVDEFVAENTRRLQLLHQFDVLRADRCVAGNGLEARVPFLDRDFVEYAMGELDQTLKTVHPTDRPMEKWVLRKAFEGYLPDDILWRQKDAFSDAVGYSWVNELKWWANTVITDYVFECEVKSAGGHNAPLTKEEALYRGMFMDIYDFPRLISEMWRPKWTEQTDPSAKKLNIHSNF